MSGPMPAASVPPVRHRPVDLAYSRQDLIGRPDAVARLLGARSGLHAFTATISRGITFAHVDGVLGVEKHASIAADGCITINFCTRGYFQTTVAGGQVWCHEGQIGLLAEESNCEHRVLPAGTRFTNFSITARRDCLAQLCGLDESDLASVFAPWSPEQCFLSCSSSERRNLLSSVHDLSRAVTGRSAGALGHVEIRHAMLGFLSRCFNAGAVAKASKRAALSRSSVQRLEQAARYFEAPASLSENIQDVAGRFGFSRSVFFDRFKQHFGVSAAEYRFKRAFERAAALIATSEQSITAIAAELGYSSPSNFARDFRKVHGCSPRTFRATRQAGATQ